MDSPTRMQSAISASMISSETMSPSKTLPTALDANNLFDSIANFVSTQSSSSSSSIHDKSSKSPSSLAKATFDPIAFLNHHFQSEAALVSALPSLRSTLSERIESLDSAISSSIQRQTDLADQTLSDLKRAKTAVTHLQHRVAQVKTKASQSEQAVQEITKDMKRLDTAKRNLSKTITGMCSGYYLLSILRQYALAFFETNFYIHLSIFHTILQH